ncbi:MAG: polymerase [Micavibrio sp.]|nr:polymerase [Micavibrio sp.]
MDIVSADHPDDSLRNVADRQRKIIHIDMDAFYASVEQRDNPELRGKPVAVGGSRERGVVAAASYEARKFGVRSAMASTIARRKCPQLIFVKPRFDAYKFVSQQIHEIFSAYTPLIEPLSLDEAYLDVTDNLQGIILATEVASQIRQRIFEVTGLTASAGISYNKFLAKTASSQRKPNGQFVIPPGKGEKFVETLPIEKFYGVGPATAEKMQSLGIATGADLKLKSLAFLQQQFGKSGSYFYDIARGIDHREVRPDRVRKSVGAENTFSADIYNIDEAKRALDPIIDKVVHYCAGKDIRGRTVTLKVKYADFEQITRSRSLSSPISDKENITEHAINLLLPLFPVSKGIRLLGVTLSSLQDDIEPQPGQMALSL